MADAPWYLAPSLGALAGGAAGLVSGMFAERVRQPTTAVRAELARLDDLRDKIHLAVLSVEQGRTIERASIDQLIVDRGRLGTKLNRLAFTGPEAERVRRGLENLSMTVGDIEDSTVMKVTFQRDFEEDVSELRRAIIKAAEAKFPTFRLLGPG